MLLGKKVAPIIHDLPAADKGKTQILLDNSARPVYHMNEDSYERIFMMHSHAETLAAVRAHMPEEAETARLYSLFKVFGDSTRMRILLALSGGELCVCALTELLQMDQSAVSHQLRVLRDSRLVTSRREGKTVYYSLADNHVETMISMAWEHVKEDV